MAARLRLSFILTIIFLLSACSHADYVRKENHPHSSTQTVYLTHHGWHTGIVLQANTFPDFKSHFPSAHYLEFGWGDREFYQADEITLGMAIRGLFWPTDSVMHVVGFELDPANYFINSQVIPIALNQQNFDILQSYILDSFETPRTVLKAGLYGRSLFYPAQGKYHMFNTCNSWNAEGLKRAGVIDSRHYPTANGLLNAVKASQKKVPSPSLRH